MTSMHALEKFLWDNLFWSAISDRDKHGYLEQSLSRKGPLSYQVKVSGDRIWNRHIDHLLESVDTPQTSSVSIPNTSFEKSVPQISSELDTTPGHQISNSEPGPDELPDDESTNNTPLNTSSTTLPSPAPASTPPRRYPQRLRHPPDYYHDSYMYT